MPNNAPLAIWTKVLGSAKIIDRMHSDISLLGEVVMLISQAVLRFYPAMLSQGLAEVTDA